MVTITVKEPVIGSDISVYKNTTIVIKMSGLGKISGYSKLWFTAKIYPEDEDDKSIIQIEHSVGTTYLNRKPALMPENGSIEVDNENSGSITITLHEQCACTMPTIDSLYYDVKVLIGDSSVEQLVCGRLNICATITKAIH